MAELGEINSFMGKFVSLWQSGRNASLKVESKAGQAHVTLQLDLGHPLHHPQHQQQIPPPGLRASRVRRRQRRAAERQSVADAERKAAAEAVHDAAKAEKANAAVHEQENAEEANERKIPTEKLDESIDEKVSETCDNAVNDAIPQLDGDIDISSEPTYCKICKECPDEFETAEDVSYHVMNNHETQDVLNNYGKDWIEERRYCIRRFSPFSNWFSTPFIT